MRGLVLVAKTLQNLANGIEFGAKENYMVFMNAFLQSNRDIIHSYFDEMAVRRFLSFPSAAHRICY
jgi:Ras GTPase-activating protein 1